MQRKTKATKPKAAPRAAKSKAKPKPISPPKGKRRDVQARVATSAENSRPAPIRVRTGELKASKGELMHRPDGAHFDVYALAGEDVTTIDVYDVIGDGGLSARMFREALNAVRTSTIVLRINSPGGSVFDAVAMYNDLVAHPARIEVQIVGLAASAASLLAMAGDSIEIADNAFIMIHNTWTVVAGDTREMASAARTLERFDAAFARTYSSRAGISTAEAAELMNAETWLDAGDAVDMGFADRTTDTTEEVNGCFDLSSYVNAPSALRGSGNKAPRPAANKQIEAAAPDLSPIAAALARLEANMRGAQNAHQFQPAADRASPVAA